MQMPSHNGAQKLNYFLMNRNLHFWAKPSLLIYHNILSTISLFPKLRKPRTLASNLSWNHHYKKITGKAYKLLGLLRRTFTTDSISAKKHLYISIVRSQLLYCSQVWRPHYIKDILILERIQRRATKYILNDYKSSYKSRLLCLNLLPLMYIYEYNDLIFFIKSYKSASPHFNIKNYIMFRTSNTRYSSSHKMIHQCSSSTLSHHFYFCRLPWLWNSLPSIDLTLPSSIIAAFLKTFLWSHFVKNLFVLFIIFALAVIVPVI